VRVLGFGTYDTARHPRVGTILDGLRAHGDDVVEVNAPLGFSTAERVAFAQRPWTAYRFAARLAVRWAQLAVLGRRMHRTRSFDAVVVGYLGQFDVVLARLLFPRTTIVLDLLIFAGDTARDRRLGGGARARLLGLLDRLAVACASVVVVDTEEHRALLPARQRAKGVEVPVGAGPEWYAAASEHPPSGGPLRVVFYGLFTPLQGAPVIGAALARLPAETPVVATLVGAGQDLAAARAAAGADPRVTWLDWVHHERLPALVASHDVCLGIFGAGAKAARVVPNKVFQGAAAGCAVVTSDTVPQRRTLGEAAVLVPAGDSAALAEALRRLAADRDSVSRLRAAARELARSFTPAEVVVDLRARLIRPNATDRRGGSR
jgi:glycosyltransferase involved in cell wall biosynthesis